MNINIILGFIFGMMFIVAIIWILNDRRLIAKNNKVVNGKIVKKEFVGKYSVRGTKTFNIKDCYIYTFSYGEDGKEVLVTSDIVDDNWKENEEVKIAITPNKKVLFDLSYSAFCSVLFLTILSLACFMSMIPF